MVLMALVPLLLYAAPAWWSQHNVLIQNGAPDDYAPLNQGQLKNIAKAATAEMDAKLTGGAGEELHNLVNSWSTPSPQTNDFAPVNLGQLKKVAQPFYDRLIALGIVDRYPWLSSPNPPDDFAGASIGQAKNLFSFEIQSSNLVTDSLADRIAPSERRVNLALESDAVWSWNGSNAAFNADFDHNYPRRIPGLSAIRSITAGDRHLVALAIDGTVLTWGENEAGQLGDGTLIPRETPALVPNLSNIISVKAGDVYTLALNQDGTVLAWGDNFYGQLGSGDTTSSKVPRLIAGLTGVRKIAAGFAHGAALTEYGAVWTWGHDHFDGRDINNANPTVMPDLFDVIEIGAGYEHTLAVKADGTVWAWGANYSNQIGNGSTSDFQATPVQVRNLANITKVASRYDHSLALAGDGTVWAWGYNFFGQLGDGTTQIRRMPVQVSGLTDVIAIATSWNYSLAMRADGTVWTWGDGATGILPGVDRHVPQQVGLGLVDTNHNEMDDRWELNYFGNLDQSPEADFDGDGISNRQEYVRGTNPADYFNGIAPIIEIAGGNNQIGDPGTFLSKPFKVRLRSQSGQVLVNAPVTFTIRDGSGGLATVPSSSPQPTLLVRTDLNGEATAYHALPDAPGTSTRTMVSAGLPDVSASVVLRGIVKLSPPSPTPSAPPPDPNSSPTPTASPTPVAPYRYAIIDLGKDIYPRRINNQDQILVESYDSNGEWAQFRWKGGALERLNYLGPHTEISVNDINDSGVVVGHVRNQMSWRFNAENENQAGLVWPANNSNATKVSAPAAFPSFQPKPGSIRYASLTAINNANNLYGDAGTGTVRGFLNSTITVVNAELWPAGGGSPLQLSQANAVNSPPDSFNSNWQGSIDSISRANSAGHYIGSKFTPFATSAGFLDGTPSGMIDGQSVSFDPVDINEAGIVIGSAGADMIVSSPSVPPITISGASPLAINDHIHPVVSSAPQSSPAPTPIAAPQILAWAGNALAIWERQDDSATWHPFGLEEMIPSMDGWDYLAPSDMNDNGLIVGTAWHTDPSNPAAPAELHGFMLVPCEVMVDGNRDNQMSFDDQAIHDADQTSEDKPYRFWVNDDQDATSGTNDSEEVIPVQLRDNQDEKIQSVRDCEDLTRLWLNIRGLTESFKSGALKFVLKFRNVTSGNPAVRVFRAAENGGRGYLTNEGWGALQASPPFDVALPGTNGPGIATSTTGIHVHRQFWQGIDEVNPVINLLFEGVEEGEGELYFEIIDPSGRRIGTSPGVSLHIKNVQKMYERAKAQPEDIVGPYTVGQPFVGPVNYVADPNANPFAKAWDETDQCVVFVHGWNVSYDEYGGVAQTMFKRLWHQGFKGHFASFRWDTRKSDGMFDAGEYNRSENRAYIYGASFKDWVTSLSETYTVSIIGHSMGNVLCGESLRQGLRVRNYLLMEAAIPMSCYAPDAERLARLEDQDRDRPTPDYHLNPTTNETTLGYRGYISTVAANLINFYNEADWALATGRTLGIETNWEKNQIDYKPDGSGGSVHNPLWNYDYDLAERLPFRAWIASTRWRYVTDSWEMKAFVARSRTKAVGSFLGGGSIGQTESLRDFGFGNQRPDHSGQFTRNVQAVDLLYKRIRERIEQ
jgi:alpha-tubulin suppressor-like RCC1 family protein